jgi:hypothetical protein
MHAWVGTFAAAMTLVAAASVCWAENDPARGRPALRKPSLADALRLNVYADNAFRLYLNGELVAVDSIAFLPHNVVSVDILPAYPMTIAVMAIDNADPRTGMEYANTNVGDGGFILKLSDGTVSSGDWKALRLSWGPVGGNVENPRVESVATPDRWFAVDFDDSAWPHAREYSEEQIDPKEAFYQHDFQGARFIWSDDLRLDNVVLLRTVIAKPPDGKPRADFRGLTDTVPAPGGRRENPRRPRGNSR